MGPEAQASATDASAKADQPSLAQSSGRELSDIPSRLWDLFSASAAAHPDHEALVSVWQDGSSLQLDPQSQPHLASTGDNQSLSKASFSPSPCLRWTYRDLLTRVNHLADSLTSLGCEPNMRLAVVLWNSAEWGLFFWAATKVGMAFIPIDPRAADDIPIMLDSMKPHVVVVHDAAAAMALEPAEADGRFQLRAPRLRVVCSGEEVHGWIPLGELLDPAAPAPRETRKVVNEAQNGEANHTNNTNEDSPALIVFTSGTTGNPKACPHTNIGLISQAADYDLHPDPSNFDRWLVHTPVCHIFAINNALRAWKLAETVVFAAKSFDVSSTLKALVREKCSIMSATPTLVKALMAQSDFPGLDELCLNLVTIGGTTIGRDDIDLCKRGLGAKDAIQAYGLSEGAPLLSWSRQDPMLVDGFHPGVGKALPGTKIRICRPDAQEILARSEVGELHVGGTSVIQGYMGGADPTAFYSDYDGRWLMTGDQARMDDDGVVHILGRYKDLIIRGGENISPVKIESALSEIPGLQAQVVGIPDDIAGQVPVAIVNLPKDTTKAQVFSKVNTLDQRYRLAAVYTLEELGFTSMPITSLGKPKKSLLKAAVQKLRDAQLVAPSTHEDKMQEYRLMLQSIWEDLTGTLPGMGDSVSYYADSITMLQYCERVSTSLGMKLYLQDLAEADTIEKQAQLLNSRGKQRGDGWMSQSRNDTSFERADSQMGLTSHRFTTNSNPTITSASLSLPNQVPSSAHQPSSIWETAYSTLRKHGLDSAKVEDILPIRSSLHRMVNGQRPQSYHVRMVFRVRDATVDEITVGLENCLIHRPMFRTILFQPSGGQPHHAVVEASTALFAKQVFGVEVATEKDATDLQQEGDEEFHSSPFMFTAIVIRVEETNQHYLCMTYNHSVIDAMSLLPFHREVDRAIKTSGVTVPSNTPYRLFADLFEQYQDSRPGKESVAFHVQRLRGISKSKRALWPYQRAPGWMMSHDETSPYFEERQNVRDSIWMKKWESQADDFRFPRRSRLVRLPQLTRLRENTGVTPAVFTKCAIVLFNVLRTGSRFAVFNSFESARSWPFVPQWMQSVLPSAMSIDGPTFEWLLTMSEVERHETVMEFIQRMDREQQELRQHEHVPWDKIVEGLGEEGSVAVDASFRQSFVWDVSMGILVSKAYRKEFESIEPIARHDWADCGLFWNAFMLDKESLFFIASWDSAQMSVDEIEGHCDMLADVMRKLAEETNWHQPMRSVFELL